MNSNGRPIFTYFIQRGDDGPIKIGLAFDIPKRIKGLATGSAEPLRLLAFLEGNHERRLHKKLHEHRMCGEWFAPTLAVRKEVEIAAIASAKIKPPSEEAPRAQSASFSCRMSRARSRCISREIARGL